MPRSDPGRFGVCHFGLTLNRVSKSKIRLTFANTDFELNSASAGGPAPAHVRGWRTDYDYTYIADGQHPGPLNHYDAQPPL
jgi:hypothetical protein